MVSAVIVDDELHCIEELKKLVECDPCINILASVTDSEEAADIIIAKKPDLLFLDIQMPVRDGFEIIDIIHKSHIEPFIIFITAYDAFAIQAIKSSVFDYLLKPLGKKEFDAAIDRFHNRFNEETRTSDYIRLLEKVSLKTVF